MVLENIYPGLKVKNYPTLCELLEEPVINGGTSKEAQIKRWEQHFSWKRDGQAFIIVAVFDSPQPKPFRANDLYTQDILAILHDHFEGRGSEAFYSSGLFALLGFTNGREIRERLMGDTSERPYRFGLNNYDYRLIQYNFNYHVRTFKQTIASSLDRLQDRGYLEWRRTVEIKQSNGRWRHATPEEIEIYNEMDASVRESLGIKGLSPWRYKAYNEAMEKKLAEHKWAAARPSITIDYNPQFEVDETDFDARESKRRINKKAVAKMLAHIDSDIKNDIEYKTYFFDNIADADDAWIIDYFYPTQEEKYIGISSGTMDDLKNARRELVDMYIALDGAVTDLRENAPSSSK